MTNNLFILAKEAFQLLENEAVLVDIREDFEVENVWIERDDVLKIPYVSLVERKAELPKNKKLILCCAVGLLSEIAASQLKEEGYNAVALKDGLIAWKKANLPMKTAEDVVCKCKCCQE